MNDTPLPEVGMSSIIQRVVDDGDNERLRSFTSLLNTFNYAIQVQSGRAQWEPSDYRLFAIALTAMDQIGLHEPEETTSKTLLRSVESAMRSAHGSHAK